MNRKLSIVACILSVALAFSACGSNSSGGGSTAAGGEPAEGNPVKDTLVVGIDVDATAIDPTGVNDITSLSIVSNLVEPLVRLDPQNNIVPALAEKWDISEDGLEYTFYITQGTKYHNGEEVTADDVVYTIHRTIESEYSGPYMSFIDRAEKVDDGTVKVILKYPYAPCLSLLAYYGGVVKESFYADGSDGMSRNPIGSGPYQFVEWAQGDRIVLKAFDGYYKEKAPIENITYKIIKDKTTAAIALEKGEVDMYLDIADTDIPIIEANPNLAFLQEPSVVFYMVSLNTERAPLNNPQVRQAIAKAVDKEAIILGVMDGNALQANSFIPENVPGYIEGFDPLPYNVDLAKAMLADAGYADGLKLTITVPENRSTHAQLLQADLANIGVQTDIEVLEAGAYWDKMEAGEYDISIYGWSYICMDPDVGIYSLYQSGEILAGNYARYNNPKVDQLLSDGRLEADPDKRNAIYQEIETTVMTDAAYIPLYWRYSNVAYDNRLKNVEIPTGDMYYMYNFSW